MKLHEQEIRDEIAQGRPFVLVTSSGDRIKVRGEDWIFLPPLANEDGQPLDDRERSDLFQVWSSGRNYRWVAFEHINVIENSTPT
jgi:hypothetical protein